MEIQVIEAIPGDVYAIRQIQKLTWLDTYPNLEVGITREDIETRFASDDTEEGKKRMEERRQRFYNPNRHMYVAKDGEKVIGFSGAEKEEHNGRIQSLYLLPEYQGHGVGRKLMEAALTWLGSEQDIYLNVASYNDKAIAFYEKFGFKKTGKDVTDPVAVLPSGKTIPEIEMVRAKL